MFHRRHAVGIHYDVAIVKKEKKKRGLRIELMNRRSTLITAILIINYKKKKLYNNCDHFNIHKTQLYCFCCCVALMRVIGDNDKWNNKFDKKSRKITVP